MSLVSNSTDDASCASIISGHTNSGVPTMKMLSNQAFTNHPDRRFGSARWVCSTG
jgi:hypothetical protein